MTQKNDLEDIVKIPLETQKGVITIELNDRSPSGAYINFPGNTKNVLLGYGKLNKRTKLDETTNTYKPMTPRLNTLGTSVEDLKENVNSITGEYHLAFIPGAIEKYTNEKTQQSDWKAKDARDKQLYQKITTEILPRLEKALTNNKQALLTKSEQVALNKLGSNNFGYSIKIDKVYDPLKTT